MKLTRVGSNFSNPQLQVRDRYCGFITSARPHSQSILGVVLLHLLLIPGTAFLTGGARVWEQELHPHRSQLNLTLLTIGSVSPS